VFSQVLGLERVGAEASFFELGGDSLRVIELVSRASAAGLEFSPGDVFMNRTVAALAAVATQRGTIGTSTGRDRGSGPHAALLDNVLLIRRGSGATGIFCVPEVSGFALPYIGLAEHVPEDYPIYGLQDARNQWSDLNSGISSLDVEVLAASHIATIKEIQPHGPYRLVGWSFGGLVAQEIAVSLQRRGDKVDLLACLDAYPAGAIPGDRYDAGEDEPMQYYLSEILATAGIEPEPGIALDAPYVAAALKQRGGCPVNLDGQWVLNAVTLMRERAQVAARFAPRRFTGDFLLLATSHGLDEAALTERRSAWRPNIAGEIKWHVVDSSHEDMLKPPALHEIGRLITAELSRLDDHPATSMKGE
jgi:thioesterase domain-containing protein